MNQPSLKLLIVYDAEHNEYAITDHNLNEQKAAQQVEQWQPHLRSGCRFIALDQKRKHQTLDAQDCRPCREQVRLMSGLKPPPKFKRREQ